MQGTVHCESSAVKGVGIVHVVRVSGGKTQGMPAEFYCGCFLRNEELSGRLH